MKFWCVLGLLKVWLKSQSVVPLWVEGMKGLQK